ncbi:polyamine aminopropyltransferase [Marinifilum fragile]|uniref:polyamine aminopropyltransferase n=1 Tax=Marinifilum fragile TaxID=570161 RepID=UPI002AAC4861|nr:polyamine aminopropyltransferase [Marinifilum fragile]
MFKSKSTLLKAAIFATGFSGVVAEYILSTLATYFLGDSTLQWVMTISLMLFSMGLGARFSKIFEKDLLKVFLLLEFTLSILVSFAPLLVYTASAYTQAIGIIIYSLAVLVGLLIGMEIPLVIRINDEYEKLRFNISNILENDYYGSLLGGIFFAFIGLPFFGLIYTPFILGFVNFAVSIVVMIFLWDLFKTSERRNLSGIAIFIMVFLTSGTAIADRVISYGEQLKYADKVVYAEQTKYQRIVITQWKNDYWLYLNGNQQLCTRDEVMYHEPLVHPAMSLHPNPVNVLVLGGGDGCAVREILKYPKVEKITLVDLDPAMTELGKTHPMLTKLNENSLHHEKVVVKNADGYTFLQENEDYYDIIIIDLPDPRSVELGRLYSYEFYKQCYRHMRPGGVIVTQAGSPYFATRAFSCIVETMKSAGFETVPMHNQVITLGEWGWSLGVKQAKGDVKKNLRMLEFEIPTRWINNEAMALITSFGKDYYPWKKDTVLVNRIHEPVLYKYYLKGNWDLY